MAFISHEESTEDDKYLATLWLDKFVSYRDAYPQRDDRNKRDPKQTDRYVPPAPNDGKVKGFKNLSNPLENSLESVEIAGTLKTVKNRAKPITSTQSRVFVASQSSLLSPPLEKRIDEKKNTNTGLVLTERILADWKKRFHIAFSQLHAVQDGDQNR